MRKIRFCTAALLTSALLSLCAGAAPAEVLKFTGSPGFLLSPAMVVGVYTPEGKTNFATFHRGGVASSGKNGAPLRIVFGINNTGRSYTYQFLKALLLTTHDLELDKDHLMVISPDEGAMNRAIYFANILGVDVGMFYKRRDYSTVVNGRNPIVAHEFLGDSVEGKDVIIMDDMIASGESMIDVAKQLKARKAKRVFCVCTFGLFTSGLDVFDKAKADGIIEKVITTNLTYQSPELLSRDWHITADMSKYIALLIDHLNHDASISDILDPNDRIQDRVNEYRNRHTIRENY